MADEQLFLLIHWEADGWFAQEVTRVIQKFPKFKGGDGIEYLYDVRIMRRPEFTSADWSSRGYLKEVPAVLTTDDHEYCMVTYTQLTALRLLGQINTVVTVETGW